nr:hypothetical protein [Frankia sp. QA3]
MSRPGIYRELFTLQASQYVDTDRSDADPAGTHRGDALDATQ